MAKKKVKISSGSKKIKDQFILTVGDEGAILCHYISGKLMNRMFVDSPYSADVKLMEKLFTTYSKLPITLLVDVIEQNYVQQVFPPVSAIGVRSQIDRRMKRDFQPNDLNNYIIQGRSQHGRKDWNAILISLSNNDPFSRWLEIVLKQDNDFGGVYLLPVESQTFIKSINDAAPEKTTKEWNIMLLHNKVGGFRIVVFKKSKIVFTRLAQHMIGDNVPEVIVGNMEQEIMNTVEYIKRLGFPGESESKITIIAGADILRRIDRKNIRFGETDLLAPYQAAERVSLSELINENDKFADIVVGSFFASQSRRQLRFESNLTKKISALYMSVKGVVALGGIIFFGSLSYIGYLGFDLTGVFDRMSRQELELNKSKNLVQEANERFNLLPDNTQFMLDVKEIDEHVPGDKERVTRALKRIGKFFAGKSQVKGVKYEVPQSIFENLQESRARNQRNKYSLFITFDYLISEADVDYLSDDVNDFVGKLQETLPEYKIEFVKAPFFQKSSEFEQVTIVDEEKLRRNILRLPAEIRIEGDFDDKDQANSK